MQVKNGGVAWLTQLCVMPELVTSVSVVAPSAHTTWLISEKWTSPLLKAHCQYIISLHCFW